jgi:hypothetical protein
VILALFRVKFPLGEPCSAEFGWHSLERPLWNFQEGRSDGATETPGEARSYFAGGLRSPGDADAGHFGSISRDNSSEEMVSTGVGSAGRYPGQQRRVGVLIDGALSWVVP